MGVEYTYICSLECLFGRRGINKMGEGEGEEEGEGDLFFENVSRIVSKKIPELVQKIEINDPNSLISFSK